MNVNEKTALDDHLGYVKGDPATKPELARQIGVGQHPVDDLARLRLNGLITRLGSGSPQPRAVRCGSAIVRPRPRPTGPRPAATASHRRGLRGELRQRYSTRSAGGAAGQVGVFLATPPQNRAQGHRADLIIHLICACYSSFEPKIVPRGQGSAVGGPRLPSLVRAAALREDRDDLGAPEVGLPALMFAGELAAAVQPGEFRDQKPEELVAACEQAVTVATVTAAGCLAGLVDAVQALSALAG